MTVTDWVSIQGNLCRFRGTNAGHLYITTLTPYPRPRWQENAMLERLRQVAFLVRDLQEAGEIYERTLGMKACHSQYLPPFPV